MKFPATAIRKLPMPRKTGVFIYGTSDIGKFLKDNARFASNLRYHVEHAWLIGLSSALEVTHFSLLSVGSYNYTVMDSAVIFQQALIHGCRQIILAHTHPSDNLELSSPDKQMMNKLKMGCDILDIKLVDFIVASPSLCNFYSGVHHTTFSGDQDEQKD